MSLLNNIFDNSKMSSSNAYEIAALHAFSNVDNKDRNISIEKSLETISNNLVEILYYSDKSNKSFGSSGSGLMITTGGYILTAYHVIENAVNQGLKTVVKMQNNKIIPINLDSRVARKDKDIVIIKAETGAKYSEPIPININLNDSIKNGQGVRVLGFRDGQKYNSLGLITNNNYRYTREDESKLVMENLFRTDVRGVEGQSGGAIVNIEGELIGLYISGHNFGIQTSDGFKKLEELGTVTGTRIRYGLEVIKRRMTNLTKTYHSTK